MARASRTWRHEVVGRPDPPISTIPGAHSLPRRSGTRLATRRIRTASGMWTAGSSIVATRLLSWGRGLPQLGRQQHVDDDTAARHAVESRERRPTSRDRKRDWKKKRTSLLPLSTPRSPHAGRLEPSRGTPAESRSRKPARARATAACVMAVRGKKRKISSRAARPRFRRLAG